MPTAVGSNLTNALKLGASNISNFYLGGFSGGAMVAPAGYAFLVSADGYYLMSDDGYYLIAKI